MEKFVWNGRKPKIHTKTLTNAKRQGGMKLFDVRKKDKSIKLSWIKRIMNMDLTSQALAKYSIHPVITNSKFWYLNVAKQDLYQVCKPVGYWKSVMEYWCEYNHHQVDTIEQVLKERIWYNSHIKIANKLCYNELLVNNGVWEILDLIDNETGYFFTHSQIEEMYHIKLSFLTYMSIIDAIPQEWKKLIKDNSLSDVLLNVQFPINKIMEYDKPAASIYNQLIEDESIIDSLVNKWSNKLGMKIKREEIIRSLDTQKLTRVSKYQSFQFKLLHNAILLNDRLFHCGVSDTQNCYLCNGDKENYQHLFINCPQVKELWNQVLDRIRLDDTTQSVNYEYNGKNMIFNCVHTQIDHFINLATLIFKFKIYSGKISKRKPSALAIYDEICFIKNAELQKVKTEKQVKIFNNKWETRITIKDIGIPN